MTKLGSRGSLKKEDMSTIIGEKSVKSLRKI